MNLAFSLGVNAWDLAILAAAGYVAVMSLVRLMSFHRDYVLDRFRREMVEEQLRRKRQQQKGPGQQAA